MTTSTQTSTSTSSPATELSPTSWLTLQPASDGEAIHRAAPLASYRDLPPFPQSAREPRLHDGEMMAVGARLVSEAPTEETPVRDRRPPVRQGRPEGHRSGALERDHLFREGSPVVERTRVLLAEDHADTRALLACMLRQEGYEVVEAASGYDLLDEIAAAWLRRSGRLPDLIITDVRMPGPTGLRVLDGIRASTWAMPVIVITAFGDAETHAEARRLGAYAVLDKPFELDELRRTVADVLNP